MFLRGDKALLSYELEHSDEARPGRTSLAIACFVTAHARVMLFRTMAKIGLDKAIVIQKDGVERLDYIYNGKLLYTDTDSVFYTSKDQIVPHGDQLGEWCDETQNNYRDPNARIDLFVSMAPKCYSKATQRVNDDGSKGYDYDTKSRGITTSRATDGVVNIDAFYNKATSYLNNGCQDLVKLEAPQEVWTVVNEKQSETQQRCVTTEVKTKAINITSGKRMVMLNDPNKFGWTQPIGHCGDEILAVAP